MPSRHYLALITGLLCMSLMITSCRENNGDSSTVKEDSTMGTTTDAHETGSETAHNGTAVLFVVQGQLSVEGGSLRLHTNRVEWFSNRPERRAGFIGTNELVTIWNGSDASDPPNGAITGERVNAVVILKDVSATDSTLSFNYKLISGSLEEGDLGEVSVFIDPVDEECDYAPYPGCI